METRGKEQKRRVTKRGAVMLTCATTVYTGVNTYGRVTFMVESDAVKGINGSHIDPLTKISKKEVL